MRVLADPESMAELISDCADLPLGTWHPAGTAPAEPDALHVPADWSVNDVCLAQVACLDDYGS